MLDASAAVELILATDLGARVADRIADEDALHAPHLLDLEVAQVLRRIVRIGDRDVPSAAKALSELRSLDIERHEHQPLLDRVWALRDVLTAYDAAYVAVAETLGARVLTCDAKLARVPRVLARRIELLA